MAVSVSWKQLEYKYRYENRYYDKIGWPKLSLYHYIFCQMSVWVDFKRKSKKSSFLIYMNNEAMLRGEKNKFL